MNLTAMKPLTYATRRLLPGDDFVARKRHGRLLVAIGKARLADPDGPAKDDEKADPIADLRARYTDIVGKRPYHGWDATELQRRIDEAQAS